MSHRAGGPVKHTEYGWCIVSLGVGRGGLAGHFPFTVLNWLLRNPEVDGQVAKAFTRAKKTPRATSDWLV